jgi:hypothetical protein
MADGYSHGSLRPVDPDAEADRLTAERVCHHCGTASSPLMATRDGWQCMDGLDCFRRQDPAAPDINSQRRAAGLREYVPPALLDHGEIRALLAHTALVIKPGETLIIRVKDWRPDQVREYQEALDGATEHLGWPKAIVIAGDELAVAQADVAPLAERVRTLATRDRTHG